VAAVSFYRIAEAGVLFSQGGPLYVDFGAAVEPPVLTPLALDQRIVITGHSIPDAFVKTTLADAIVAMGGTIQRWSSTGPFSTARWRWENRPVAPDEVRGLMEAPGASYDAFVGTEAHGGTYFVGDDPVGRSSVIDAVTQWVPPAPASDNVYVYALLWHNLAASTGAQTHYMSFWRNDPPEIFGADWRAAQVPEIPLWDGIVDYVNAHRAAGTPAMRLVPLLSVFCAIYDAIQAGQITGITMGSLFSDSVHQDTAIGRWVSIATLLAVVYRRHPDTLPANAGTNANISETLAAQLRPVVWSTCLETTRAGLAA
jgi:hypothetical protein